MKDVYDFGGKIGGARKDISAAHAVADRRAGFGPATKRPPRPPRFSYYSRDGRVYVARVVTGRRSTVPIAFFDTLEEARNWRMAQPTEVLESMHRKALASQAVTDENCRRPVNRARVGTDYRQGMPVAPHVFLRTFEVYGVEFGNWQDNRQASIDQAFDALRDLAETVGIAAEAVGFGGRLGLAFGARGHGKAAAHYEPARVAINLTKTAGAGCLAHEWFHAWDHQASGGDGLRYMATPELRELWDVLRRLPMYRRARAADATRSKAYWSEPHEMAARAFEAWVRARVENDYLANIRTPEEFDRPGSTYPYPLAEEMPAIDAAFRKLFKV